MYYMTLLGILLQMYNFTLIIIHYIIINKNCNGVLFGFIHYCDRCWGCSLYSPWTI